MQKWNRQYWNPWRTKLNVSDTDDSRFSFRICKHALFLCLKYFNTLAFLSSLKFVPLRSISLRQDKGVWWWMNTCVEKAGKTHSGQLILVYSKKPCGCATPGFRLLTAVWRTSVWTNHTARSGPSATSRVHATGLAPPKWKKVSRTDLYKQNRYDLVLFEESYAEAVGFRAVDDQQCI